MDIQPWWYTVEPYPGESLSHYLGRFRRENGLSVNALGRETELGGVVIGRWERFYFNPPPTPEQIQRLAAHLGLTAVQVRAMLPAAPLKLAPIRLCAACYAEAPYHRLVWQYKATTACPVHGVRLLSECPRCKKRFPIPADWNGHCQRCGLAYGDMLSQAFPAVVATAPGGSESPVAKPSSL